MLHKRKKLNQKGFTMVELLAAVTIVAVVTLIAVKGVSGMIERAKTERVVQQQKALIIAAESYLQANTQLKPKTIGESRLISVEDLKKANYLKTDIVNANGESCMKESKVRVYKLSKMEYSYYPYIYCGDEKAPDTIDPPKPSIHTYFTDASGKEYPSDHLFTDVSKARLGIVLKGNADEDIEIDGYSYSIDSLDKTGRRTIFDSGSLSANRKNELLIFIDLKDYINVSDKTEFFINIFVRNVHGGEQNFEGSLDMNGNNGSTTYEDTVPPTCAELQNQAPEGEWINKYSAAKDRTITAVCEDGDGSGCVRDTFSRSWPNTSQKSAEYAYIKVRDNRGNETPNVSNYLKKSCTPGTMCCARVNVDTVSPTVKITAYKYNGSKILGGNILSDQVNTANNAKDVVTINTTDFSGADTTTNEEGWLNLQNYSGAKGVAFKVKVSDDIGIASWTWETNIKDIWETTNDRLNVLSTDAYDGDSFQNNPNRRDLSINEFYVYFSDNGRRKGILTVKDIAGNETKFVINANIDTRPVCESGCNMISAGLLLNKYLAPDNENLGEVYIPGTWSNLSVIASPSDEVVEYINNNPGSTFKYIVNKDANAISGHSGSTASIAGPYTTRNSRYYFDNSTGPDSNGKNKIAIAICSISGNCVQSDSYDVFIDTVPPLCTLKSKTSTGYDYDGSYWLMKGINAIVTATCSEKSDGAYAKSGCEDTSQWPKSFSYTYDFDLGTEKAGAKGVDTNGDKHGSVRDLAGNVTECPANMKIYVDHTDPTCTVTAKLNNSSNYTGSTWGKKGDKITVYGSCNDTGGAGSGSGCMIYTGNKPTFDSSIRSASYEYKTSIETTKATPYGNNKSVYVSDGAGNVVTCGKKTVKLDIAGPTCSSRTGDVTSDVWRNDSSIKVTQSCTDNLSGCDYSKDTSTGCNTNSGVSKSCSCDSSQGSCSRTYTSDLTSDYIDLYDVAGNSTRCSYYVNRDTVDPSCGDADKPEPTSYATERTRSVGCIAGSGSPCSKTKFSKTWKYVNKKIENGTITISDTAGNTKNCTVAVKVNKDNVCNLGSGSELFGSSISSSPITLSSTRDVTYFHHDYGNTGSGTTEYSFTVKNTNKIYNYYPQKKGSTNNSATTYYFGSRDYPYAFGFQATWSDAAWCNPNGSSCGKTRYCYARVCKNEAKCGSYLGWTADAINKERAAQGCSGDNYSRCWCTCSSSLGTGDYFN